MNLRLLTRSSLLLIGFSQISQAQPAAMPPVLQPPVKVLDCPTVKPALLEGNRAFAFDVFAQIQQKNAGKNLMISPSSLGLALQMLREGATGATATEMTTALKLKGVTSLYKANLELSKALECNKGEARLDIANSLWIDDALPVMPSYTRTLQTYYRAEVKNRDLQNTATSNEINAWASNKTQGRISQIVPPNSSLGDDAKMLLMNAVYFKGSWAKAFDKAKTQKKDFYAANSIIKQVDTMSKQFSSLPYFENDDFQMVRMPYKSSELAMYIMLPRQDDQLEGMLAKLNPQNWKQWTDAVALREGYLELPRFKFEGDYDLNSTLSSLGMSKMFEVGKDFSRITDPKKALLGVSGVRQKTFIEVNEEGSEAAAVTSILLRTTSVNPNQPVPFEFIANHPFFFAISDTSSGSLLFMGVVNEP